MKLLISATTRNAFLLSQNTRRDKSVTMAWLTLSFISGADRKRKSLQVNLWFISCRPMSGKNWWAESEQNEINETYSKVHPYIQTDRQTVMVKVIKQQVFYTERMQSLTGIVWRKVVQDTRALAYHRCGEDHARFQRRRRFTPNASGSIAGSSSTLF